MLVPGDATIRELIDGLPAGADQEKLQVVMPSAVRKKKSDRCYEPLVKGMKKYEIDTPLRAAHFIAQESATRPHRSSTWKRSRTVRDTRARSDLGNTQPGDGKRFKGRGLIQLTGRANYEAYSNDCGIDYVTNPTAIATDPFACVDVACWYWHKRQINRLADKDDVKAVTKAVNGGFNGLDDRMDYLYRSKAVLGIA